MTLPDETRKARALPIASDFGAIIRRSGSLVGGRHVDDFSDNSLSGGGRDESSEEGRSKESEGQLHGSE